MSVGTGSINPGNSHRLEISREEIYTEIQKVDVLETLKLIKAVAKVRGRLDDELLERLAQHSFFGSLDLSDWEKIVGGPTRRYRNNLLWLLRTSFNVFAVCLRVTPLKVSDGWAVLEKRSDRLIHRLEKRSVNGNSDTEMSKGQRPRRRTSKSTSPTH